MKQNLSIRAPVLVGLFYKVLCSSVFEVSILRLNNNRGVNQYGRCCSGTRTTPPCTAHCHTYFTMCLMHSLQAMPMTPLCTYGSSQTGAFDNNNLIFMDTNTTNTVTIPIDFRWPGRFTLLVEAWHETTSNVSRKAPGHLIIRGIISNYLNPSMTWRGETTITPTTEMQFKYRITCRPHFYGNGCDVLCRSRDDQFGHYTCNANGSKICRNGWNGTFCDQALCPEGCLQNKGFCERPYECRCPMGWYGPDCSQCQRYTGCLNGICYEPYQCICKDGWTGILCDVDLNYCSKSNPCLNGGTCISDIRGNYSCLCPERHDGENCQIPFCYDEFCLNGGLCEVRKSIRICTCAVDFYGDKCQNKKLNCDEITCHNGGKCVTGINGGTCECYSNSTGTYCETRLDACISNPCDNGGQCVATAGGYGCNCLQNYAGIHCSYKINPCHNFRCDNGARCIVKKGNLKPICECPDGFIGDRCHISTDPCHKVFCFNGGSCRPSPMGNGFICYCAENFHGEFCEESTNMCDSSPCKNGAQCKNYMTSFLCICTSYFYGEHCELEIMLADNKAKDTTNNEIGTTDNVSNTVNFSRQLLYSWLIYVYVSMSFLIFFVNVYD